MTHYIGLDAHTSTCTFVILDREGNLLKRVQVPTTESQLLKVVREVDRPRKLVFEESNLSKWLFALLEREVDELLVCNVLYLAKRPGSKDDFKDALHLANELRGNHIVPVFHEKSELMEMRSLVSNYQDLIHEIVRTKNRYKSLLQSEGCSTRGASIYREPERIALLKSEINRFIAENLLTQIERLEATKQVYLSKMKRNAKTSACIRRLDTVPGFDVVRAHVVAALVCSPSRFKNKHKFWAYSMLVRHQQVSDGKTYGKKTIYGRSELKGVFMGAAISAVMGSSSLRKYYDQLRSKGTDDRKARKAVARKIAAICLSILKNESKYDEHYEEKRRRELNKKVI